jgi:hypothetical protein
MTISQLLLTISLWIAGAWIAGYIFGALSTLF